MAPGDDRREALLAEIEARLLRAVPDAAAALGVAEPVYALLLVYDDGTSAEGFDLHVTVCPDSSRQRIVAHGGEADTRPWSLPELGPTPTARFDDDELNDHTNACYGLLLDDEKSEDLEDDEILLPFRQMLHRVAQRLNGFDWRGRLNTTPDFVVLATDRAGMYLGDDAPASLPDARLQALRSQHRFPF